MIDAEGKPVDEFGKPLGGAAVATRYLKMAEIALRRAIPAIPDVRELECTRNELSAAVAAVVRFNH